MSDLHSPQQDSRIPFEMPSHLDCPSCGVMTDSLKEFRVIETFFFFPVFYAKWQMATLTTCPRCMRIYLLKRLGVNLLSANLAWPFIILPPYLYHLVSSLFKGHSEDIVAEYHEAYLLAMRRAEWALEDEAQ